MPRMHSIGFVVTISSREPWDWVRQHDVQRRIASALADLGILTIDPTESDAGTEASGSTRTASTAGRSGTRGTDSSHVDVR